jgi:hypothetical protein
MFAQFNVQFLYREIYQWRSVTRDMEGISFVRSITESIRMTVPLNQWLNNFYDTIYEHLVNWCHTIFARLSFL